MEPLSRTKLREFTALSRKQVRLAQGRYLAEGQKLCQEAVAAGLLLEALLVLPSLAEKHPEWIAASQTVYTVTEDQLARISTQFQPDGVLAILTIPDQPGAIPVLGPAFLLHQIQDPGNLGTLQRTAAWFGFRAIYTCEDTVEWTNPKVVRASMGACFHVPVYTVHDFEGWVRQHAARVLATYLTDSGSREPFKDRDWILLGSESHGLPPQWQHMPEIANILIPRAEGGFGESLNVAAAGAILADRLVAQRQ